VKPTVFYLRILQPKSLQWLEICGLTSAVLGLSHWLSPTDPYLLGLSFPWIWVAPLLLALRYGLWAGFSSAGIFLTSIYIEIHLGLIPYQSQINVYVLGGMALIALVGEFGSRWNLQLATLTERTTYLQERVTDISRSYQLLGMSHHQLERSIATRPLTLRMAFGRLRGMLPNSNAPIPPDAAERFLQLLAQYFELEIAAFFPPTGPDFNTPPLTTIGHPNFIMEQDPVLDNAVATEEFSHVMGADSPHTKQTRYLIVAPAKTADGTIVGWLVVESMKFLNFHDESLYMMKVFLSYFADGTQDASLGRSLLEHYPDCPPTFAREIFRLTRLQCELNIQSRVVLFRFNDQNIYDDIIKHLLWHARGLDITWTIQLHQGRALCALLPLSDDPVVEGYIGRYEKLVKERLGLTLEDAQIHVSIRDLSLTDPFFLFQDLLPDYDVHETTAVHIGIE